MLPTLMGEHFLLLFGEYQTNFTYFIAVHGDDGITVETVGNYPIYYDESIYSDLPRVELIRTKPYFILKHKITGEVIRLVGRITPYRNSSFSEIFLTINDGVKKDLNIIHQKPKNVVDVEEDQRDLILNIKNKGI